MINGLIFNQVIVRLIFNWWIAMLVNCHGKISQLTDYWIRDVIINTSNYDQFVCGWHCNANICFIVILCHHSDVLVCCRQLMMLGCSCVILTQNLVVLCQRKAMVEIVLSMMIRGQMIHFTISGYWLHIVFGLIYIYIQIIFNIEWMNEFMWCIEHKIF